jgi:hypothetical protein
MSASATASPSPSTNAVSKASVNRVKPSFETTRRSAMTNSSFVFARFVFGGSSSRWSGTPSATTRTKPFALRFSMTWACVTFVEWRIGKVIITRVPGSRATIWSAADCGVSGFSVRPQTGQIV